jgi:hypothetical protein
MADVSQQEGQPESPPAGTRAAWNMGCRCVPSDVVGVTWNFGDCRLHLRALGPSAPGQPGQETP